MKRAGSLTKRSVFITCPVFTGACPDLSGSAANKIFTPTENDIMVIPCDNLKYN